MMRPVTVQVYDIVGGSLCVSTDDGQRLHDKIAPLLQAGTPVVLSFDRVDTMISAFLNASIGQLYGEIPDERVDKLLTATHLDDDDAEIWQHVIDNAKAYFSNPNEFDRAWHEELDDDEIDDEE